MSSTPDQNIIPDSPNSPSSKATSCPLQQITENETSSETTHETMGRYQLQALRRPVPAVLVDVLDLLLHRRLRREALGLQQRALHRQQRLQARLPRRDHVLWRGKKKPWEKHRENQDMDGNGLS